MYFNLLLIYIFLYDYMTNLIERFFCFRKRQVGFEISIYGNEKCTCSLLTVGFYTNGKNLKGRVSVG